MSRILFVEDDQNLGMLLKENLENKGYDVDWYKNGGEGMSAFTSGDYDLCILDIMLPSRDGYELAKDIKAVEPDMPLIFLTSKSQHADKIKGFETGCDDYITKPFSTQELALRINAILKRTKGTNGIKQELFNIGKFEFDYRKMTLESEEESQKLSSKECELIYILAQNENVLVNRKTILEKVWGNDDYFSAKSMDVYISKVRKYFKADPDIEILNAYGVGFKMVVNTRVANSA
ncbi:MAG: response regulator transcription factor [Chitinophagales bacterium]|nr:response regulator transcription factor [Chitinophagaceae bacterium]MCB9064244.1 response regulator transcription factor [Chitinophagales bacterium]